MENTPDWWTPELIGRQTPGSPLPYVPFAQTLMGPLQFSLQLLTSSDMFINVTSGEQSKAYAAPPSTGSQPCPAPVRLR